jgi:hypothetical protein
MKTKLLALCGAVLFASVLFAQMPAGKWLYAFVDSKSVWLSIGPTLTISATGQLDAVQAPPAAPSFTPTSEGVLYSEKQPDGSYKVKAAKVQSLIPVTQDGILYLLHTSGYSHQADLIAGSNDTFRLNSGVVFPNDLLVFRRGALLIPGLEWELVPSAGGFSTAVRLLVPLEATDTVFIHYR